CRAGPFLELGKAERRERGAVEPFAFGEIAHCNRDVIDHKNPFPSPKSASRMVYQTTSMAECVRLVSPCRRRRAVRNASRTDRNPDDDLRQRVLAARVQREPRRRGERGS